MEAHSMKNHRNIFYRLACLLILGSLLAGVAACGGQNPTAGPDSADTNQPSGDGTPGGGPAPTRTPAPGAEDEPALPVEPGEAPEAGGPVVITFAGNEYERSLYEPLMEEFHQQNPDITVQFAALPEPQSNEEATSIDYYRNMASGGDTMMIWNVAYIPAAQRAYFRELTPLMESAPTFQPEDFFSGMLEACMDLEGRSLGVPLLVSFNGIYYNEEAFDAAGLPRPKPGWTLDDFRKAAIALSGGSGDTAQYGFAEQYTGLINPFLEIALENNGGEIDLDLLEPVAQWYLDLIQAKAARPIPYYEESEQANWQKQWEDWQTMFKSDHRPAMWTGSLGETMPGSEGFYAPDDPFANAAFMEDGFVPFPVDSNGLTGDVAEDTTPAWVQCAGMSDGTLHPREAWAWLNFLTQRWLVRDRNNLYEIVNAPARASAAEKDGYWKNLPDEVEPAVRYILEHAWFGSSYPDTSVAISQGMVKAAAGKAEFAAALEEARVQYAATPSPTPNTTPVVVATPKPTLAAGVVVVEYFYNAWGPDREALQAIVDAYNQQHPEAAIKYNAEFNPSQDEDYYEALSANFDCYTGYPPFWPAQSPEAILSLNSLVEGEGQGFLQDFDANLLEFFRHEGELYGLPAVAQPQMMSYNADLLAKRGLQPPATDWTFDDLIDLSTQVASTSASDLSYGMIFGDWDDLLFIGRGIQWADTQSDPPRAQFDSPEFSSGLEWIAGLIESGVLFVQTDMNYMEMQEAMQAGQIAFWTSQAGQPEGWYFQEGKPSYNIGVAPMPAVDDPSAFLNYSSNLGHFITRRAEDPQLCWDWIKYLSEQPGAFKGIPARKSTAASPQWEALVGKENAAVYREALSRVPRLEENEAAFSPIAWPFYTWRREAVAAMLKGEDYKAILPQIQKKAEDYLACMSLVDRGKLDDQELNAETQRCAKQADPQGPWAP
jgi:ABC-type glycerol-3-phosphate transport system substrate-binding protein